MNIVIQKTKKLKTYETFITNMKGYKSNFN